MSKVPKERRGLAGAFAPARVACVWLPQFAVQAERARRPDLAGRPVVLVAPVGKGDPVVRACSPEALAAGLAPDMPAHEIPQRCPGASLLPFDAPHYGRCYEVLLRALDAVTPEIEIQPLEVFHLDLSGLPHLETAEAVAELIQACIPAPYVVRVGIAGGKFTAWVAANGATAVRPMEVPDEARGLFLREAPSTLLPLPPEMGRRLHLMGLRTLGQVARTPRSAMLAQFGWEGERAHRLACGEDREPLVPYEAPRVVRETFTFAEAAPTVALFHLALRQLLQRLCARPERGNRGIRQLRLQAAMESGEVWERTVTLRKPLERWDLIFEELSRRLEAVRPAGALTELIVEVTAFAARLDVQALLFSDERQNRRDRLALELAHLRERTGRPSVYRIVEVEPWSRLPENQYALLSCEL